jgi:hypothetical protein
MKLFSELRILFSEQSIRFSSGNGFPSAGKGFGASVFGDIGTLETYGGGMAFTDREVVGTMGADHPRRAPVYGKSDPTQRCGNHRIRNAEGRSSRSETPLCKLPA